MDRHSKACSNFNIKGLKILKQQYCTLDMRCSANKHYAQHNIGQFRSVCLFSEKGQTIHNDITYCSMYTCSHVQYMSMNIAAVTVALQYMVGCWALCKEYQQLTSDCQVQPSAITKPF